VLRRPPELRQSAHPPVLAARSPTIARHPPPPIIEKKGNKPPDAAEG